MNPGSGRLMGAYDVAAHGQRFLIGELVEDCRSPLAVILKAGAEQAVVQSPETRNDRRFLL